LETRFVDVRIHSIDHLTRCRAAHVAGVARGGRRAARARDRRPGRDGVAAAPSCEDASGAWSRAERAVAARRRTARGAEATRSSRGRSRRRWWWSRRRDLERDGVSDVPHRVPRHDVLYARRAPASPARGDARGSGPRCCTRDGPQRRPRVHGMSPRVRAGPAQLPA